MTSETKQVQEIEFVEAPESGKSGAKLFNGNRLDLIQNVQVNVEAKLGHAQLPVSELMNLQDNSVVKLDCKTSQPIDLTVDGNVVARGQLVVADEHFAIQITEIVSE